MNLRSKSSSDTAFYSLLPNRRANFTANKVMSDTKLILEKLEKLDVISVKIDAVDLKVTNLDVKVTHLDAKVDNVDRRVAKFLINVMQRIPTFLTFVFMSLQDAAISCMYTPSPLVSLLYFIFLYLVLVPVDCVLLQLIY